VRPDAFSHRAACLSAASLAAAGGGSDCSQAGRSRTDATLKTRICNSELEPPSCERCGASFDRLHPHPRMSPKRFCSERCRKAAENARAKQRKQYG
jgi:hypothetical protein